MAFFRWAAPAVFAVWALPCFASETVYLKSGFHLDAKSHKQQDETIVLYTDAGSLEFPTGEVERIEVTADPPAIQPITASPQKPISDILTDAAVLEGLEPELVRSVARIESGLHQEAISRKGALGLMQLMPQTAQALGVQAKVAEQNAEGGAKYLRDLLVKYGGAYVLALAAYNAGPGAVTKYGGIPPYAETRKYILNVLHEYYRQKQLAGPHAAN